MSFRHHLRVSFRLECCPFCTAYAGFSRTLWHMFNSRRRFNPSFFHRQRGSHRVPSQHWYLNWCPDWSKVCIHQSTSSSEILIPRRVADLLGRRRAMSSECAVFIIGVIVQISSSHSWPQFAVGRLISGFGVGALSAAVPMVCSQRHATILYVCERLTNVDSIKQKQRLRKSEAH